MLLVKFVRLDGYVPSFDWELTLRILCLGSCVFRDMELMVYNFELMASDIELMASNFELMASNFELQFFLDETIIIKSRIEKVFANNKNHEN